MRYLICTALLVGGVATASAQPEPRFQGMDTNRDGRITREEWRGNARSFARHDWNNDGVLSGDELQPGSRRQPRAVDTFGSDAELTDWTPRHFQELDHDRDGRLSRSEWHYDVETYHRIDRDRDGVVSRNEFLGVDRDDDRGDRFDDLDVNRDGRVTRGEWHASDDAFRWLDRDNNGTLSRAEVVGPEAGATPPDWFASLDVDRNGRITSNEWHWAPAAFTRRDVNRDGAITRDEFARTAGGANEPARTEAYRRGYDRGLAEGRQAGREDKQLRNRWDLDGQRELVQADSGYRQELGSRADYQDGYREGFRLGYGEGFGRR